MFTNIEAARTITSAFKSLMEISLFQWSHVSKHSEWKLQVNAWFSRRELMIMLRKEFGRIMLQLGCVIFSMRLRKSQKYTKERELLC